MRKFAANYLIDEAGVFLKNGIVVTQDNGTILRMIDTKGDLRETEQLIFYNGILLAGCFLTKITEATSSFESDQPFRSFVLRSIAGMTKFSIQNLIDLGKQVQVQFPEMTIPSILNEISDVLLTNAGFTNEDISGIYLINGVDLSELRFTPKCRLKKIL